MIPPANHPAWRRLIKGETTHQFGVAAASLLFFRLREQYRQAPESIEKLVTEARRFFEKYEAIFAKDIGELFR